MIIDTVAVGTLKSREYDETLLRELATRTGGEFTVVQNVGSLIERYKRLAEKRRLSLEDLWSDFATVRKVDPTLLEPIRILGEEAADEDFEIRVLDEQD